MPRIAPCLWFDANAEEAVAFYTSIFRNSKIKQISRYGEGAPGRRADLTCRAKVRTSSYALPGMGRGGADPQGPYNTIP
jgi:predicted 3-demethylubiquinone-9 3-methyltransferase (glyoxalase superfamily)